MTRMATPRQVGWLPEWELDLRPRCNRPAGHDGPHATYGKDIAEAGAIPACNEITGEGRTAPPPRAPALSGVGVACRHGVHNVCPSIWFEHRHQCACPCHVQSSAELGPPAPAGLAPALDDHAERQNVPETECDEWVGEVSGDSTGRAGPPM